MIEFYPVTRHNSVAHQAYDAELEDVFGIFDVANAVQALDGFLFVASKIDRLPKYAPEKINIGVVVDRQAKMDIDVQNLTERSSDGATDGFLQQASQSFSQHVDRRLKDFSSSIGARLDHLQTVCTQLANSGSVQSTGRTSPPLRVQQQQQADRSMNMHTPEQMNTPASLLQRHDLNCTNASHYNSISQYADATSMACLSAAETSILFNNDGCTSQRIPGWT
jgi:hypothetical protein